MYHLFLDQQYKRYHQIRTHNGLTPSLLIRLVRVSVVYIHWGGPLQRPNIELSESPVIMFDQSTLFGSYLYRLFCLKVGRLGIHGSLWD